MPKIRKDKKKPGAVPIKQGENNIKLNLFSSAGSVLKSDGTLSRPRIYKPLYGPSQGDETADWTDDDIGLLHVIRLRYSIFCGGQTSTLS